MGRYYPLFFLGLTAFAFILSIFGFMNMIPSLITLPILFVSIYLTIFSFTNRKRFKGLS
ncbi:hypothetical protein KO561_06450 [Radiobacillus kanasensis]|uniref:hypothetical protein n=1 Tax=Radiobacillus kanasensis TaxID=2844358 RepID=UPI001E348A77|nr:hypothetical protein [Radiobacillus kanasensis]UFU00577.1 hypothetical protein KO561_06450 [Radiobacillus kanasensis]